MSSESVPGESTRSPRWLRADIIFSFSLGAAALVALLATHADEHLARAHELGPALFFLAFGLFTIEMGYHHPRVGYVSFDRVAQLASFLVLGPVDAAWINGLASLLFPWRRLWRGVPFVDVLAAALSNFGMMALMILAGGWVYRALGGPLPLADLQWAWLLPLFLTIVTMQLINDLGVGIYIYLRDGQLGDPFNLFAFALEAGSALGAILVAIVYNTMPTEVLVLLVIVLSFGMLALRQFARMRTRLEAIVAERTSRLRDQARELERLATHDQLTGLVNRRYVDDYLEERIAEFDRYERDFAIALVDLDHFKQVNDRHSHAVGDEVLRRVAALLVERCRETDVVARYGGEEFLLCFPETDEREAAWICESLRNAVEKMDWSAVAPGIHMTMSAGVAAMRPGLNRRILVNRADRRLYDAKNAGRNMVLA